MVVTLNPAISSNRAVVPMKKANSKSVTSTPAVVSFEGEGSGMKGRPSAWGRFLRRAGLFLTGATTVVACSKTPIDGPNQPVTKPLTTLEQKFMTYAKDAMGVDPSETGMLDSISTRENINITGTPFSWDKGMKIDAVKSSADTIVTKVVDDLPYGKMIHDEKFYLDKNGVLRSKALNFVDVNNQSLGIKEVIAKFVKNANATDVSGYYMSEFGGYIASPKGLNQSLRAYPKTEMTKDTLKTVVTKLSSVMRK